MGGTHTVWEEPGKQKPRGSRAQELARSRAQENECREKVILFVTQGDHRIDAHRLACGDVAGHRRSGG